LETVRDILETILIALLLAVLIRVFIIETFVVDGPSMEATLWDGQRLLVSKMAYRFSEPKRGDVVIFRYPLDPSKDYVKRVIAVGGDTIEVRMGRVYVNSERREEPYVLNPGLYDMRSTIVPEGCVFVMGDNRTNSEDSRSFGPIKVESLKGKAIAVIWPLKSAGFLK
jgi:signal peptidase I